MNDAVTMGDDELKGAPRCRGTLYVQSNVGTKEYTSYYYVIQKDSLISYPGRYKRKVLQEIPLMFCVVTIMKEFPKTGQFSFGFTLRNPANNEFFDFYVGTQAELDLWVENLRLYCYRNDFAENYSILRQIDRGKSSKINLLQHKPSGQLFVGKAFEKESFMTKASRIKLLKNEITALRQLASKHTVSLQEFYQTDTEIIIVMEYMEAGTLFTRLLTKRKYHEKEAAFLLKNMVEALDFIHSQGFLHRDIKLENVFLSSRNSDFQLKIGDFDLACYANQAEHTKLFGTPGYIAPEIFNKVQGSYSPKSDLFSCGIVLYAILFGSFPMKGKTAKELLESNKTFQLNVSTEKWNSISVECQDLLMRMLCRQPEDRIDAMGILQHKWIKIWTGSDSVIHLLSANGNSLATTEEPGDNDDYYLLRKNINIQKFHLLKSPERCFVKFKASPQPPRPKSSRPHKHQDDDENRSLKPKSHMNMEFDELKSSHSKSRRTLKQLPYRKTSNLISGYSNQSGGDSNPSVHPFYKQSQISNIGATTLRQTVGRGGGGDTPKSHDEVKPYFGGATPKDSPEDTDLFRSYSNYGSDSYQRLSKTMETFPSFKSKFIRNLG